MKGSVVAENLPKAYSMPFRSPMFVPPPYRYEGNRQVNLIFKTAQKAIEQLVPSPLVPNPDGFASLYYASFRLVEPYKQTYNEVGIVIPVAFKGVAGVYFAYMYLDSAPGVVGGREIWGFPKKDATIKITDDGTTITALVSRNGAKLIEATFEINSRATAIPPNPFKSFYNLKVIPSVGNVEVPEVMQLTSMPIVRDSKEVFSGTGAATLSSSALDLLGEIPILAIVHAQLDIHDMSLCCGEVVYDYLKGQ